MKLNTNFIMENAILNEKNIMGINVTVGKGNKLSVRKRGLRPSADIYECSLNIKILVWREREFCCPASRANFALPRGK